MKQAFEIYCIYIFTPASTVCFSQLFFLYAEGNPSGDLGEGNSEYRLSGMYRGCTRVVCCSTARGKYFFPCFIFLFLSIHS